MVIKTIKDFSGNNFTDNNPVNVCKMKCEMSLNETDSVNVEKTASSNKGFKVNSNLFTIKYGNEIYSLNGNVNYISSGIIHQGLFDNKYGVISELVFHGKSNNNLKNIYLHIPIYKSFKSNVNGNLLKTINDQEGRKDLDISKFFPKNNTFYTYSNKNKETSVVFMNSNIMIKDAAELANITSNNVIRDGSIRDDTNSAADYKFFMNSVGILEGGEETTIIDCQPIDDDGMLLADREKGLNQTGINQTSNLEVIGNKIMENPLAQTAIGVVLLYILTKLLRTGQLIFKSKESN